MNLKPLGDRVIIKQDEAEETTASGLILTSNSKEKPQRGKVIPVSVKPGDTVIYGKYGGQDVTVDGEEYVILRADDLYAVVD